MCGKSINLIGFRFAGYNSWVPLGPRNFGRSASLALAASQPEELVWRLMGVSSNVIFWENFVFPIDSLPHSYILPGGMYVWPGSH